MLELVVMDIVKQFTKETELSQNKRGSPISEAEKKAYELGVKETLNNLNRFLENNIFDDAAGVINGVLVHIKDYEDIDTYTSYDFIEQFEMPHDLIITTSILNDDVFYEDEEEYDGIYDSYDDFFEGE